MRFSGKLSASMKTTVTEIWCKLQDAQLGQAVDEVAFCGEGNRANRRREHTQFAQPAQ